MHGELEIDAVHHRGVTLTETRARVRKYRDIAALGRGGMGDVHLTAPSAAVDESEVLVIKRLRATLASDAEFLQKFLDEARAGARLHHRNIAETHEVGFDGLRYFIAREYLDGRPMSELLKQSSAHGGLPLAMQLRVLADALAGLDHAHEQRPGIVHADFSPSNIFVLYDGRVKVVDFGIAKTAYNGKTKVNIFKGKIQYVAPEQYAIGPIDRRSDIYSAGVILWEALTHRRMWNGLGDLEMAQRVVSGNIPLPSSIEPGIPKRLEAICMRALAARPECRYPTAGDFRAEIESFLDDLGEPISAKSVGAVVAEMAGDHRARLDKVIHEQLELLRQEAARQEAATPSLAPTVTSPRTLIKDLLGERIETFSIWRPRSALDFATAGVLLGMLTGLVLVLLSRWSDSRRAVVVRPPGDVSAASAPMAPAARAVPTAAPIRKTRLTVETVPSSARVGIDGSLLPVDAHDVVMILDHAAHRVWAEAPGFQTRAEWVRLDGAEHSVTLVLVPVDRPRASAKEAIRQEPPRQTASKRNAGTVPPASAPPASAPPAPPRALDSAPKPSRGRVQLDTSDPWKN